MPSWSWMLHVHQWWHTQHHWQSGALHRCPRHPCMPGYAHPGSYIVQLWISWSQWVDRKYKGKKCVGMVEVTKDVSPSNCHVSFESPIWPKWYQHNVELGPSDRSHSKIISIWWYVELPTQARWSSLPQFGLLVIVYCKRASCRIVSCCLLMITWQTGCYKFCTINLFIVFPCASFILSSELY